jgi:hypothetical protein
MDNRSNQKIEDYKDLIVWQRSMELAEEVYRLVKKLPKEELFALSVLLYLFLVILLKDMKETQQKNIFISYQ